jgi:glycosyltransferase involved in cell wall biosynthesis
VQPRDSLGTDEELVEIVIPVFNEAPVLEAQIQYLSKYLGTSLPFRWQITIVDNGSTDDTLSVARKLECELEFVKVMALGHKGRGGAIRAAWMQSESTICCYMDVDMSTGLDAFLPLVAPLMTHHSDIAIGSRLSRTSNVARSPKRELISRLYNFMIRTFFAVRFTDAQCGFKAIRTDIARKLIPAIRDDNWFFDTELLLVAEHNGLRIHEVAVDWIDDPDSRVHIRSTALEDIRGLYRMGLTFLCGRGEVDLGEHHREPLKNDLGRQLISFAKIGTVSTSLSVCLFLLLMNQMHPVLANLVVLAVTTPLNFWFNRRFTFGHRTRSDRRRQIWTAVSVFLGLVVISSFFLVLTDESSPEVSLLVALTCWISSSAIRFALLRSFVFRTERNL